MNATLTKKLCWGILFGVFLLMAGAVTESRAVDVGDFEGSWVANGTRKLFPFGDRKVYTFEISGPVSLKTELGKT